MRQGRSRTAHNPSEWETLADVVAWARERAAADDIYVAEDLERVVVKYLSDIERLQTEHRRLRNFISDAVIVGFCDFDIAVRLLDEIPEDEAQ